MTRFAVYAAPAPGSTLHRLASAWLGRDAATGERTRPADPARDPLVAEPARYGFHATLRAPFRLKAEAGAEALARDVAAFAAATPAPVIGELALRQLETFFALVPGAPEPAIGALEARVLELCEPFRAPLTAAEVARRRPERLTARQREHLDRWGYPFVRDAFRFHMTLTGPVAEGADAVERDLRAHFADLLGRPLPLDGLAVFVEPAPGAPFCLSSFHPFGPAAALQPAGTP